MVEQLAARPKGVKCAQSAIEPGLRRIGTYTPVVRQEIRRGEKGGAGIAQVRRLEFRSATPIGPESFHQTPLDQEFVLVTSERLEDTARGNLK